MKKHVTAALGLVFIAGLSCTSPFSPSTNLGQKVLNSIDSSLTAISAEFKSVDSLKLSVLSGRSVVVGGADTSQFLLQSGDHRGTFLAGSLGDDSAFGYAEFRMSSSNLSKIRAASGGLADSIRLWLYYDSSDNDWRFGDTKTFQVFLCERKYVPFVRNDLTTAQNFLPCTTITLSHSIAKDTFALSLGRGMISRLLSAAADTETFVRTVGLAAGIDSVIVLKPAIYGDTAICAVMAEHFTTQPPSMVLKWDTLVPANMVDSVKTSVNGGSASVVYYTRHFAGSGTAAAIDTAEKFIGAVSLHASGGGIVRFTGKPVFQVFYRAHPATASQNSVDASPYYDICVTEKTPLPPDSLVASWQADRFVEVKVNLKPFWDSMGGAGTGKKYRIVQDASFLLNASDPVYEKVGADTSRVVVYGLLDTQITNSRAQSLGAQENLLAIMNQGTKAAWLNFTTVSVHPSSTPVRMPVAVFLQHLYETTKPDSAYLYLFVRPTDHFSRVIFEKKNSITCNAVFSNPQR
jgi:hypothetical protein